MSKSAPKAPDYAAAAEQQAQSSKEVTEQQTWANRADQFTPFGQQTWQNQQQWDPATQQYINRWAQTTQLNPESQAALDSQLALTRARSELGESMTGRLGNEYGQAMDWNQFQQGGGAVNAPASPERGNIQGSIPGEQLQRDFELRGPELDSSQRYQQQANDALYGQWADRALPQQAKDTDRLRTQLYNTGLREGDQAYDEEMRKQRESQGDQQRQAQYQATIGSGAEAQRFLGMDAATRQQLTGEQQQLGQFGNQAALGQFGMGMQGGTFANQAQQQDFGQQMQAGQQDYQNLMQSSQYQNQLRQQEISEAMQARGFSLNEINALMSGQQVQMPQMPSYNTAARSEGNQALQAAQLTGQADLDRFNAQQQATQGMMSGIGSMAGAGMMMSDRRFKRDVKRIGATAGGTSLYSFRYIFGGSPMVGVMADEVPHAVTKIAGINFVDYSKVM
jgi:hypothetical protein